MKADRNDRSAVGTGDCADAICRKLQK